MYIFMCVCVHACVCLCVSVCVCVCVCVKLNDKREQCGDFISRNYGINLEIEPFNEMYTTLFLICRCNAIH